MSFTSTALNSLQLSLTSGPARHLLPSSSSVYGWDRRLDFISRGG
jgi:hypothetical protein